MGKYSYTSYSQQEVKTQASSVKKEYPRVGYFYLKEDKPSAIVRFDVSSGDDLTIVDVHNVKVGNAWRNVACLRDSEEESWKNCPLCEHNIKSRTTKVFVRMLEYVIEEGKVVARPVVWSRYKTFADELISNLNDYGDLRDCLFKISYEKDGKGKAKYSVKYQPEKGMYTEDAGYVKDFSAFKNFLVNKHSYMERTFEELKTFVETGEMASRKPKTSAEESHEDMTETSTSTTEKEELKQDTVVTREKPAIEEQVEDPAVFSRKRRYEDILDEIESPDDENPF